jgi:hypothetical protein
MRIQGTWISEKATKMLIGATWHGLEAGLVDVEAQEEPGVCENTARVSRIKL